MAWTFLAAQWIRILPADEEDTGSIHGPERFHMLWSNKDHVPQLL